MVMSTKTEFWIAVVGLSGRQNGDSFTGPGKSCLCDRFMYPENEMNTGHTSIISQQDFHGPIVNTDHFLYWGRTRRTVDGKVVEFNIIEQTEFLDDVTYNPFNARDPYLKRASSTSVSSTRKVQYVSPDQLQDPRSQKAQKFANRKIHIDGFLCVYDVSKVTSREAGTQYKFVFELLDLIDVPVVLVATKCDKARPRHFEELLYLAKVQKVPIVETSASENVNVAQAFFSLVRIFNRQVIMSKKHIQYYNPKLLYKKTKKRKRKKDKKEGGEKEPPSSSPPRPSKEKEEKEDEEEEEEEERWEQNPLVRSPLSDSLLSEPAHIEPSYERIPDGDNFSYENVTQFSPNEHTVDTQSGDSQVGSVSCKTSSEEYIPAVRRAPYDNYENVRYNAPPPVVGCPSPTSRSSDSGFLARIPDHMRLSAQMQRPWEAQYYTGSAVPSTSCCDTSSTSLEMELTGASSSRASTASGAATNGQTATTMTAPPETPPRNQINQPEEMPPFPGTTGDPPTTTTHNSAPPPPPPPPLSGSHQALMTGLNRDLEEMNTLVGEISSLVWQSEPLPPPPPPQPDDTYENCTSADPSPPPPPLEESSSSPPAPALPPRLPPRRPDLPQRIPLSDTRPPRVPPNNGAGHHHYHHPQHHPPYPAQRQFPASVPLKVPMVQPHQHQRANNAPPPPRGGHQPQRAPPQTVRMPSVPQRTAPNSATLPPPAPGRTPRAPPPQRHPQHHYPQHHPQHHPQQHPQHHQQLHPQQHPPALPTRIKIGATPVYSKVEQRSGKPRLLHQHEFSPYVTNGGTLPDPRSRIDWNQ